MQIHALDIGIIIVYLISVVVIGFLLSKRASGGLESYFLGGKTAPWYVLGVSNASSMFDITGTMWLVYILFVYGLKGAWLPWLWPTFNQIFLMVYLSIWIRRSGVITGGEWMSTRFGEKSGGELARISVVIFALISVIGFLTYAFKGIGKFASVFFPWDLSPDTYAMIIMGITTIYVILGGMYSVIVTDVIQFVLLTIVSLFIGGIAMARVTDAQLAAAIPAGWGDFFSGWTLNLDWSALIPAVNDKISADGYTLFNALIMMMVFKGVLVSMAGPAPGYDMQRVLATRTNRESALMSFVVSVCLIPRWLMIAGITVLALVFFSPELNNMGADLDFELILPYVLNNFIPAGVLGLMLAGLLAAFMSTFDSTVNSGASYLVVDVYKRYINPDAAEKSYIRASYVASIIVVILGFGFGLYAESIDSAMQWIVSGLWGGYTAPNVLKWYWWRFNGYGYFWGMISGIACAMILPLAAPEISPINGFPIILLVSGLISIIVSLRTPAEDDKTLQKFYTNVRPWGIWKPVIASIEASGTSIARNTGFKRDAGNVVNGVIWQMALVLVPVYFVIRDWQAFGMALLVAVVTSGLLYKYWYKTLPND